MGGPGPGWRKTPTGRRLCPECALTLDAEALALLEHPGDPIPAAVEYRGLLGWVRRAMRPNG